MKSSVKPGKGVARFVELKRLRVWLGVNKACRTRESFEGCRRELRVIEFDTNKRTQSP